MGKIAENLKVEQKMKEPKNENIKGKVSSDKDLNSLELDKFFSAENGFKNNVEDEVKKEGKQVKIIN